MPKLFCKLNIHSWIINMHDGFTDKPLARMCKNCGILEYNANAEISEWAKQCHKESCARWF